MKKIFKEPLIHFLLIGAALFLVYKTVDTGQNENEILIDNNLINELAAKWELTRDRPPNLKELKGLLSQYIEQEIFYREALAMNLDHNDEIVKRRLAQKMEFISDGLAEALQPTEELLATYYQEHKDNYAKPPIYSMRQVYFRQDKRESAFKDAENALQMEHPEEFGDKISLNAQYKHVTSLRIARDFGSAFVATLNTLPLGRWTGPVYSGLGVHLVYISDKKPAGFYTFAEVKDKVITDYNFKATNDFKKELISSLLKNYNIIFDLDDSVLKEELDENF